MNTKKKYAFFVLIIIVLFAVIVIVFSGQKNGVDYSVQPSMQNGIPYQLSGDYDIMTIQNPKDIEFPWCNKQKKRKIDYLEYIIFSGQVFPKENLISGISTSSIINNSQLPYIGIAQFVNYDGLKNCENFFYLGINENRTYLAFLTGSFPTYVCGGKDGKCFYTETFYEKLNKALEIITLLFTK